MSDFVLRDNEAAAAGFNTPTPLPWTFRLDKLRNLLMISIYGEDQSYGQQVYYVK